MSPTPIAPPTEPKEAKVIIPAAPAPAPARKPVEQHAEEKQTPAWLLAAARAHHGWPIGRELTESEFEQALAATKGIRIGGPKETK